MTEQTKREFLQLVVMKGTLECWAWAGDRDEDFRPIFRGQKAYRIQYEIHYGDIPAGFHVHHKCENSACVNPRHLLALSPDAHRAWHATKDKALRERICAGEWEQIQAAKAEAARLEREQRLGQERQRLEEQELARRREKRTEQFDWIFSRLRNGWKLREQAIKNDEAWSARRWAYLNRAITHDHVQLFCDTYTGKDEDMIPALLRSPRPNAILAAGVRIKDLCYSVLYCVLFLVFVTPLVLIVQAVLFRANLQSALVWALLIIALSIIIDLRKGTAGARLRTALREDNALFRGPPGLSPQSRPNAAGPAPGPPIVPGKRVHAFNIWVWLVGIGLLLMVGYFSQNKSVPKRYLSKESASAWTVSESDCVTNNGSKTIVTARENSDTWFDPSFYYAFFSDSCSTGDGDADSNIKPQRRKLAQRQNAQSSGTFYADLRSQRCAKRHTKIAKWTRNEISSDCRNTRRCDRCFSV